MQRNDCHKFYATLKLSSNVCSVLEEIIRPCIGPLGFNLEINSNEQGHDKIIVSSTKKIITTNDGASILKSIVIVHPIGKLIQNAVTEASKTCGDHSKIFLMLFSSMLKFVSINSKNN